MRKIILLLLVVPILSGCKTTAQKCQEYGFTPGGQAFSQCLQLEDMRRQAAWEGISSDLNAQSQRMLNQPQNYAPAPTLPMSRQTTCHMRGRFMDCTTQ